MLMQAWRQLRFQNEHKIPQYHRARRQQQENVSQLIVAMSKDQHGEQVNVVRQDPSQEIVPSIITVARLS